MSRRLPGSPVDSRSAWNVATTLEIDMTGEERVASKVVVTFPYLQRISPQTPLTKNVCFVISIDSNIFEGIRFRLVQRRLESKGTYFFVKI